MCANFCHKHRSPKGFPGRREHRAANNHTEFQQSVSLLLSCCSLRHRAMAAGVPGAHGVHVPGLVEAGCSLPNVFVTIRHLETMAATARAREPSIAPAMLRHVHQQVSVTAGNEYKLKYLYIQCHNNL